MPSDSTSAALINGIFTLIGGAMSGAAAQDLNQENRTWQSQEAAKNRASQDYWNQIQQSLTGTQASNQVLQNISPNKLQATALRNALLTGRSSPVPAFLKSYSGFPQLSASDAAYTSPDAIAEWASQNYNQANQLQGGDMILPDLTKYGMSQDVQNKLKTNFQTVKQNATDARNKYRADLGLDPYSSGTGTGTGAAPGQINPGTGTGTLTGPGSGSGGRGADSGANYSGGGGTGTNPGGTIAGGGGFGGGTPLDTTVLNYPEGTAPSFTASLGSGLKWLGGHLIPGAATVAGDIFSGPGLGEVTGAGARALMGAIKGNDDVNVGTNKNTPGVTVTDVTNDPGFSRLKDATPVDYGGQKPNLGYTQVGLPDAFTSAYGWGNSMSGGGWAWVYNGHEYVWRKVS